MLRTHPTASCPQDSRSRSRPRTRGRGSARERVTFRGALPLVALLVPATLAGQPCPDPAGAVPPPPPEDVPALLTRLLGSWEGTGTLMGAPARFHMTWSLALGDRFLRLEFTNAMAGEDGEEIPVMASTAFYRLASDGPMHATWVDSRGAILTLCARLSEEALAVTWEGAGETGRTVYRPTPEGGVEVVDSVQAASGWREFGRAVYRPTGGTPGARAGPPPHPVIPAPPPSSQLPR